MSAIVVDSKQLQLHVAFSSEGMLEAYLNIKKSSSEYVNKSLKVIHIAIFEGVNKCHKHSVHGML